MVTLILVLVLFSMAGTAYDLTPGNNTTPYAIVCSSSPGGGWTQNYGLSFINITSGEVQTAYGGQPPARAVAVSPDGKHVYLVSEMGSSISVMDAGNWTVTDKITVGLYPQDAVVSPDGSRIYVSSAAYNNNFITVIYGHRGGVADSIRLNFSPGRMALGPDGRLYVSQQFYGTNEASGDITVIDTARNKIAGTIKTGMHPVSVSVSPDGSRLYAACRGAGIVSSIDTATGRTMATAKTGRSPVDVALSRDGSTLYAVNDYFGRSFVSIINTSSMAITSKIDLPCHAADNILYSDIKRIALADDGSSIYVTDHASGAVYRLDVTSGSVAGTIDAGNSPSGISLSPDGRLYVTSKGSGGLAIINTTDTKNVTKVNYALSARFVAILPGGKKAYITGGDAGTVSVLDVNSKTVTSTIDTGGITNRLTASPDGKRVYVADTRNGQILVIDTEAGVVAGNWSVGRTPADVATSPDGAIVYAIHGRSGQDESLYDLSFIDSATGKVLSTHRLGKYAGGLAITPDGKKLYACLRESDTVLAIDSATGSIISRIKAEGSPGDAKVSPDGSTVYVACPNGEGILAFSVKDDAFIASIGGSAHPGHIAITPDGAALCATGINSVALVDLKNWTVIKTIPVGDTLGVAINPAMGGGRA